MVRPTRLMSDSVLHFSDNRIAALRDIERAETGLGRSSTPAGRRLITSRRRSRFRYPHANRLIRWIRASVDSAAPFSRSITTASRSAMKCERGSALGVAVCAGLAALRAARLATVLEEEHDRADSDVEDHVGDHVGDHAGDVRGAGVPGVLTQRSRMPPRCGRDGSRRNLSDLGYPHESLKTPIRFRRHAASDSIRTTCSTLAPTRQAPATTAPSISAATRTTGTISMAGPRRCVASVAVSSLPAPRRSKAPHSPRPRPDAKKPIRDSGWRARIELAEAARRIAVRRCA